MKTALEWKKYYSSPEFRNNYIYNGNDLGVSCTDSGTSFKLWSPSADSVTLNLYQDGSSGKAFFRVPLKREKEGVWQWSTAERLHGVYYDFVLEIEGETVRSADPWARACGLNGQRSMAVNLKLTDPEGWELDRAPEKTREQIIYELHIKEFSWDASGGFPEKYRGKYKAFTCTDTTLNNDGIHPTGIRYLKDLGVTHIQIMPAYDYGSVDEAGKDTEFNWGYDPVNYNVPEGSYSTDPEHGEVRIREMKEMIQSLHSQGFRVIMDVVYNHTYSLDSWFQRTAPWYFYRVFDDRYGKGEKILFGEPWAAAETAMEGNAVPALKKNIDLLDENIGMFSDDTRDAVKGSALKIKRPGFVNGASGKEEDIIQSARAWTGTGVKAPSQIITYVSAHDNQTLWDKLTETMPGADERERMRLNRMAAALYMTCQGTLFFLSGEEFARTKNGMEDSYNAPITLNRLDWEQAWKNRSLVDYYRGLIALRSQLPGLCDKSANASERISDVKRADSLISFAVDNHSETEYNRWDCLKIIYNGSRSARSVMVGSGAWEILCSGEDSWMWKKHIPAEKGMLIEPQSVLVLGRTADRGERTEKVWA